MIAALFLALLINPSPVTNFQSCNPAVVSYLVRDENGILLEQTTLDKIAEQLPKTIGDAGVYTNQVSFKDDMMSYYWPEDTDWRKGYKVAALSFANSGKCTMQFSEVTLSYRGKKMRLIFRINIDFIQHDRRIVVDSLPFEEGTFVLDLSGWSRAEDQLIPSTRWTKLRWREDLLNKKSG